MPSSALSSRPSVRTTARLATGPLFAWPGAASTQTGAQLKENAKPTLAAKIMKLCPGLHVALTLSAPVKDPINISIPAGPSAGASGHPDINRSGRELSRVYPACGRASIHEARLKVTRFSFVAEGNHADRRRASRFLARTAVPGRINPRRDEQNARRLKPLVGLFQRKELLKGRR